MLLKWRHGACQSVRKTLLNDFDQFMNWRVQYCLGIIWRSQLMCLASLLVALGLSRVPHLLSVSLDDQVAVVAQVHAAHLEASSCLGLRLPNHLVVPLVHDKVAVVLHAQAVGIPHAASVGRPHRPPAIDGKVAVFLQHRHREKIKMSFNLIKKKPMTSFSYLFILWQSIWMLILHPPRRSHALRSCR